MVRDLDHKAVKTIWQKHSSILSLFCKYIDIIIITLSHTTTSKAYICSWHKTTYVSFYWQRNKDVSTISSRNILLHLSVRVKRGSPWHLHHLGHGQSREETFCSSPHFLAADASRLKQQEAQKQHSSPWDTSPATASLGPFQTHSWAALHPLHQNFSNFFAPFFWTDECLQLHRWELLPLALQSTSTFPGYSLFCSLKNDCLPAPDTGSSLPIWQRSKAAFWHQHS